MPPAFVSHWLHPTPESFLTRGPLHHQCRRHPRVLLHACAAPPSNSTPSPAASSPPATVHDDSITVTETAVDRKTQAPWTQTPNTDTARQYRLDLTEPYPALKSTYRNPAVYNNKHGTNAPSRNATDMLARLASPLLPTQWPQSVAQNYARWAFWHVGRHLFRNAHYVLGTTSLLHALGLDAPTAIAVSASLKWVLKDGAAMGTKLLLSTNLARLVDASPKRFRVLGDALMAVSSAVEVLSMLHPSFFLLYGSVAALLRQAGDAMSGPSYRVFLDAFAMSNNIGDVSSRGEAQVVVGNLAGLALGVGVTSAINLVVGAHSVGVTLLCQVGLAALHLSCTVRAVACVHLYTLNAQRLDVVAGAFVETGFVPDVASVNDTERFIRMWRPSSVWARVRLGASFAPFVDGSGDAIAQAITKALRRADERFVVAFHDGFACVMLREDATVNDILVAVLQACKLIMVMDESRNRPGDDVVESADDIAWAIGESYDWAIGNADGFLGDLEKMGWSTNRLLVGNNGFRYRQQADVA